MKRIAGHVFFLVFALVVAVKPIRGATVAPVEDFGVVGFRRDFFGTLTVTPFSVDDSVPGGAGHSRVTYTGEGDVFEASWADDDVEFVAYRIHKNDVKVTPEAYFPAVRGSRYARVVKVIDGKNLVVDFEYNGGSREAPSVSEEASGYFFIDCAKALRDMVRAADRPERFVFTAGRTYVVKGMPNIPFTAGEQSNDMHWVASEPDERATLKISAEDVIGFTSRRTPSQNPIGCFFKLNAHDHGIHLDGINIIGPTYSVPSVQPQWRTVMFDFHKGQCARTLEIRDCDTFAEKKAYEVKGIALPEGATWLAPGITGIVAGGGRRGDRGDGVIDIVGYQRFNLINATWVAWGIHSIKNNDGAGNWITIDGKRTDEDGRPVNLVYEAKYMKRNRFSDVRISFHNMEGRNSRRGVRIVSQDFAWPMLANQYWTGGTSTSSTEPTRIEIDGFTLFFGNNGDWRREINSRSAYHGILNASEAVLFDRIPVPGDRIPVQKNDNGTWRIWGWGIQKGDVLQQDERTFTVASRKRSTTGGAVLDKDRGGATPGAAHYWTVTFEEEVQPEGAAAVLTVATSRTAYLLDGRPRTADLVYERGLHGHWQYNRAEINYEFRNICFNGNYRQTAGPANPKHKKHQGLWEFPVKHEWVNCWAMKTDGSVRGEPADEIRCEAFRTGLLERRNRHPDSRRDDYHTLVDGGRLFVQRRHVGVSPVWIRNRPQLIYGSASFGEPRLCNPVLLDKKGVDASARGMSVSLVGGYTLDLSNSTFGRRRLRAYGNGTLILDNVRFDKHTWKKRTYGGGVQSVRANGLQKTAHFKLHIRGDGGRGGFRLVGEPEDGSVMLTDWTLLRMPFTDAPLHLSDGWRAVPGIEDKVRVNGNAVLSE